MTNHLVPKILEKKLRDIGLDDSYIEGLDGLIYQQVTNFFRNKFDFDLWVYFQSCTLATYYYQGRSMSNKFTKLEIMGISPLGYYDALVKGIEKVLEYRDFGYFIVNLRNREETILSLKSNV